VVTFRLEDVPMNKSLEYFISTPHWLDAMSPPLERHLDYLAETVQLLLSRRGPDAAPAAEASSANPAPAPAPVAQAPQARPAAPARNRMVTTAIGAAIVLSILGYLFFRPTAVSSGGVERQFAGTWVTHAVDGGKSNDITMTVNADGHYRSRVTVTETGNITASNGRYRMVNTAGEVTQGAYGVVGPTTVSVTGPLGTADWKRKPGTPVTPGSLAGTWQLTFPAMGATWSSTFEVTPQGTYRLVNVSEDAGSFEASNGSWQTVSQVQTSNRQTGTYQFLDSRNVSMTGPLGTAMWSRR
jgi:hypothetical protein